MADSNEYSDWHSWIEKRVCVKKDLFGTLKYFGTTHFSEGFWCGIELDKQLGRNDGMVNNVRYFTCRSNFGIFIRASKVTRIKDFFGDNFENIANINETFRIDDSLIKKVETNSVTFECETVEEKLHNPTLGSTESLGILNLDLIDGDSWDDLNLNSSLNDVFPNPQNMRENISYTLLKSAAVTEKDLDKVIVNPMYTSTPRVSRKKLGFHENDSDDSFHHLIDKFTLDIHSQQTSELFFDSHKLKNIANLTSTNNDLSELTSILNNPELSPILKENNIPQSENLDFFKDRFSQDSNEILSETFELHNSPNSQTSSGKKYEKVFNNNERVLDVTTIIEDIKSIKPEDMKPNANTTFELQCPSNTFLKLSFEETNDLTFDFKENVKNMNTSNFYCKNELNTTSDLIYLKGNTTFELKSPTQIQEIFNEETQKETVNSKCIKNENSIFNECEKITVKNANALLLEKTFVFDLSTICEYEDSKIQNESFNSKEEFLKETNSFQDSSTQLNYRNTICLPPTCRNRFQNPARISSSVSSYPCREKEKCLKEVTQQKSCNNKDSASNLKDLREKSKFLKTPFSPNSTLRDSKPVIKSPYWIGSKENKTLNKESSNVPRNTLFKNTNTKAIANKDCEISVKSKQIKPFNNKSEFSSLKTSNSKNSSVKTRSNVPAPLKNKLNSQKPKQSPNIASKFYSKVMPVNKIVKNGIQTSTVAKIVPSNLIKDDDTKNSKLHLKMPNLQSTFISRTVQCDVSQKSTLPTSNVSNKLKIPKRISLVPCFKDKLPVGVIKPRYSMCPPKKDELEDGEKKKNASSQSSKVTEKNLPSNEEINTSLKESSISANNCNKRQFTGLPKKVKNQVNSPSHVKSRLKEPLKGRIPTSLKIPVFRKN